jgi:hypothetical protein
MGPAMTSRPRTFQSKDALWAVFERASAEQGTRLDDLVNDAMLSYARSRGYQPVDPREDAASLALTQGARALDPDLAESEPSRPRPSLSPVTLRNPAFTPRAVPRAPPVVRRPLASTAPPPPPPSRRAPPPLPSTPMIPIVPPGATIGSMSLAKSLSLVHEGRRFEVDKEHFIIGRSKSQADLRVDDTNVSRQHAAIERIGSIYYLVDLGSTNGVYVGDDRVTRRALADGDVIVITSHSITCLLR